VILRSGLGRCLTSTQPRGGSRTAATRHGCHGRMFFEGNGASRGDPVVSHGASAQCERGRGGNAVNPMTGSGMQQAHDAWRG